MRRKHKIWSKHNTIIKWISSPNHVTLRYDMGKFHIAMPVYPKMAPEMTHGNKDTVAKNPYEHRCTDKITQ